MNNKGSVDLPKNVLLVMILLVVSLIFAVGLTTNWFGAFEEKVSDDLPDIESQATETQFQLEELGVNLSEEGDTFG